jgi:hypothetical protein
MQSGYKVGGTAGWPTRLPDQNNVVGKSFLKDGRSVHLDLDMDWIGWGTILRKRFPARDLDQNPGSTLSVTIGYRPSGNLETSQAAAWEPRRDEMIAAQERLRI